MEIGNSNCDKLAQSLDVLRLKSPTLLALLSLFHSSCVTCVYLRSDVSNDTTVCFANNQDQIDKEAELTPELDSDGDDLITGDEAKMLMDIGWTCESFSEMRAFEGTNPVIKNSEDCSDYNGFFIVGDCAPEVWDDFIDPKTYSCFEGI